MSTHSSGGNDSDAVNEPTAVRRRLREMRATAEQTSQIGRERPHVGAGAALHLDRQHARLGTGGRRRIGGQ